jgi:hypothetical protein
VRQAVCWLKGSGDIRRLQDSHGRLIFVSTQCIEKTTSEQLIEGNAGPFVDVLWRITSDISSLGTIGRDIAIEDLKFRRPAKAQGTCHILN